MKTWVTSYDEQLVEQAQRLLSAAADNPSSNALLEQYGFNAEERARGHQLVQDAHRAFEWERSGQAWNFLSPTPERRLKEARAWYRDTRRRHLRATVIRAEREAGWLDGPAAAWPLSRKVTVGTAIGLWHLAQGLSPLAWRAHREELARDLARARGDKPADAPPPKDTVLVELNGWWERWRLLAQRIFRGRPDLLSPFGLVSGRAPPRLRGREARIRYGEGAAQRDLPADEDPVESATPPTTR